MPSKTDHRFFSYSLFQNATLTASNPFSGPRILTNKDIPLLLLHPDDNVAVAKSHIAKGSICTASNKTVTALDNISGGHKLATSAIDKNAAVVKYGQIIGYAAQDIRPGDWVHVHNVVATKPGLDYEFSTQVQHPAPPKQERTFSGYRRANGKAGTRNYIGVISTVNCSATTAKYVAKELSETDLSKYPNIDGIVPLVHKSGCALEFNGEDHKPGIEFEYCLMSCVVDVHNEQCRRRST